MKLFISWSGHLSNQIAKELQEWFPLVINQLEPFVSSESIKKGDRWILDIYSELERSNFGIICLTKENLTEPWILFEAGALSKNINQSKVCCLLFDGLKQHDINAPLSLFQNSEFVKEDFKKLIQTINHALGKMSISEILLNKSFEKWYPELEVKIKNITESYLPSRPTKQGENNILNDILRTTNYVSNVVERLSMKLPTESLDFAKFSNYDGITYLGHGCNHPIKIYINPINDIDGVLKEITITKRGMTILNSSGPTGRGILIQIFFLSEDKVFWVLSFQFHKGETYITTEIIDITSTETIMLEQDATIWRD